MTETVGRRVYAVRAARGDGRYPEPLEAFVEAMNAKLREVGAPKREQVTGATVSRWENDKGRPSVVQGAAIMKLDPRGRSIYWLAGEPEPDAKAPPAEGANHNRPTLEEIEASGRVVRDQPAQGRVLKKPRDGHPKKRASGESPHGRRKG